jgi:hypothetical protein
MQSSTATPKNISFACENNPEAAQTPQRKTPQHLRRTCKDQPS